MQRTAKDNAREFSALTSQGYGVRLAVLVATSVRNEAKGGHPSTVSPETVGQKATVRGFAAEAGVSPASVSRYLDKWDRMVAAGWDVDRENLTPADVDTIELSEEFIAEFDKLSTKFAGKGVGKAGEIAANPGSIAKALEDPAVVAKVMARASEDAIDNLHDGIVETQRNAKTEKKLKRISNEEDARKDAEAGGDVALLEWKMKQKILVAKASKNFGRDALQWLRDLVDAEMALNEGADHLTPEMFAAGGQS